MTSDDGQTGAPPRALSTVVGSVLLLAVGCALGALRLVSGGPQVQPWQLVLLGCMLLLSEMSLVHIRVGGDSFTFTWGEGCLLIGFALVSPPWVLLVSGPTVALVPVALTSMVVASVADSLAEGSVTVALVSEPL
jgi:hypothetical protein